MTVAYSGDVKGAAAPLGEGGSGGPAGRGRSGGEGVPPWNIEWGVAAIYFPAVSLIISSVR